MRASPSNCGIDRDIYLVLDDFGRGCAWRETNVEDTNLEAVIDDLWEGWYSNPVCVICFNLSEGWVRDVSEEITRKLRQRCADQNATCRIRCISSSSKPPGLRPPRTASRPASEDP